uniref:Uncharacterized protein n=1 Tax=Chrysemys picta bellii TaxID=8478 RepID=A0A8C3IM31_CHRPI
MCTELFWKLDVVLSGRGWEVQERYDSAPVPVHPVRVQKIAYYIILAVLKVIAVEFPMMPMSLCLTVPNSGQSPTPHRLSSFLPILRQRGRRVGIGMDINNTSRRTTVMRR